MNIEYINAIPLCKIFDKLKLKPSQENDLYPLYPSLFQREEKHTLEVDLATNTWFDSFTNKSGGPLELISDWLQYRKLPCATADVQHWFRFNIGYPNMQDRIYSPDQPAPEIKYAYQSPILNPVLINNLEEKGIPFDFARKRLRQLGVTNMQTGDDFAALGLKTENDGWWVYSPYINTFTDEKSISFFPGKKYKFQTVHVFKDIFDYLTARICFNENEPFDDECIILNSYDCLEESARYLRGFGYRNLFSWLGNDPIGQQATKNYALLCSIEENMKHLPMNMLYPAAPDLNSWHQEQPNM